MTEQVIVAIISKEMCVEVKGKSGLQIAGFLRNIFQYSLYISINWYSTKYTMGIRNNLSYIFKLGINEYFINLKVYIVSMENINYIIRSQSYCDKVVGLNGNNQDY